MGYIALNLTHGSRELLIKKWKPLNDLVIAHHVTYQFPAKKTDKLPKVKDVKVVGYASTDGLECMIVSVDGTTKRNDGGTYHVTLSLESGKYKPFDSNELIRKKGWIKTKPIPLDVVASYNT